MLFLSTQYEIFKFSYVILCSPYAVIKSNFPPIYSSFFHHSLYSVIFSNNLIVASFSFRFKNSCYVAENPVHGERAWNLRDTYIFLSTNTRFWGVELRLKAGHGSNRFCWYKNQNIPRNHCDKKSIEPIENEMRSQALWHLFIFQP